MKKNLKYIILIVCIGLLLVSSIFVYAFLMQDKTYEDINFKLGFIDINIAGSLTNDKYIYPGINLINESYVLTNNSNVEIDLRIVIDLYLDGVLLDSNAYLEANYILLNDVYLVGNTYEINNFNGSSLVLIDSLTLDGNFINNSFSNSTFELKINYQVKQSKHATWSDITT